MLATDAEYQNGVKTWLEQRAFVRNAVAVLTAGRINSPLAAAIEREFALLKPVEFAAVGFADAASLKQVFRCGAMTVGFGGDGAISTLVDADGHAWADSEHTLGRLWYSGSDAVDEERFTTAYIIKPTYKWKK
jgi:anti-sigma factor RsiW